MFYRIVYIFKKLLWWLRMENTHCNSFCPTCPYFELCVYDTGIEESLEEFFCDPYDPFDD